ncbi:MAG: tyrosine-type recombinase/integrase [Lachnospiraceae bacterium]|nr:tyrosine-type recombinase/integrase [Lachnospiraceae bacterium]
MLEKLLIEVCEQMTDVLVREQIEKLKNVLFMVFHDKKIVEEKNELILAETNTDTYYLQMFVASKKVSGRKDSTLTQYVTEIRKCRDSIGKSFADITTMDLRWYLGLAKERNSNKMSTIRNKIRYLNSFYSFLVKEELLKRNPVVRVESPKTEQVIRKPFSTEELEAIRKICTHVRDRAMIEFLYSTGLRVSELASLNIGDIDIYRKEFTVIGKGNKERTIYISDLACFHLKEYFKWLSRQMKLPMEYLKDKPLMMAIRAPYKRMTKAGIESRCRQLGEIAGIEDVHPHRFRRTFATDMLGHGMKLEEAAKLMGHSKVETTMIYCSVDQENVRSSYYKCI